MLTAVNGTLNDSDAAVTGWQWESASTVNGTYSAILGATSSTYTLVAADDGKFIKVVETATDSDGGPSTISTSAAAGAVTAGLVAVNDTIYVSDGSSIVIPVSWLLANDSIRTGRTWPSARS